VPAANTGSIETLLLDSVEAGVTPRDSNIERGRGMGSTDEDKGGVEVTMKHIAMTVIACATALLIEFVVDGRWEREATLDRRQRAYEFLLQHPELLKAEPSPKRQALVPSDAL
jgi:hypothetical protein